MKIRFNLICALFAFCYLLINFLSYSQEVDNAELTRLVQSFKKDERGPYQAIRWFCPDGTVLPPQQRCPQPGGIQHALHKDVLQKIAKGNKIYLGQILAGTPFPEFLDSNNQNSRLKQYQVEKYLQAIDDGWILRRARYYRGAFQAEDEEAWGNNFLNWLVSDDKMIVSQYFLIRQMSKDIPHKANDDRLKNIRALSKTISDSLPAFIELRVKIHGQPEASDLELVKSFHAKNRQKITHDVDKMLTSLEKDMAIVFQSPNLKSLNKYVYILPSTSPLANQLRILTQTSSTTDFPENDPVFYEKKCKEVADLICSIRTNLLSLPSPKARLAMIDLSNELESIFFRIVANWQPQTIFKLVEKNYTLSKALAGCGFLEIWEWEKIETNLRPPNSESLLNLEEFIELANYSRRLVE